jgi:surfactin synthase thioesterase subunit
VPGSVGGLFVSGRSAPSCQQQGTLHLASDDVLWSEVGRLGGTRAQILDDPDLERLLLPALRSDYRLDEAYQPPSGPPLPCPVTALLGADDSEVTQEQARPWADYTRASFGLRVFPGGHFYLNAELPGLIAEIMRRLADSVPPRPPGWAGP